MASSTRTWQDFYEMKKSRVPISALTAYDYPSARLVDEAGADIVLCGDSLGMVVLGYPDTTYVSLDDMLRATSACRRAVKSAKLVADLPFKTYDNAEQGLASARALVDAGADAVKLEGGRGRLEVARAIVAAGIDFVGHLGMLPQSAPAEGAYRKKGKSAEGARRLINDAELLADIGAKLIVIECVMAETARMMTAVCSVPTIGIGSGRDTCDGQILVLHDVIGLYPWFKPKFAKTYFDCASEIRKACSSFVEEVKSGKFP